MNCVPAYGKTRIIVALRGGGVASIDGVQCLTHDVPGSTHQWPNTETTRMNLWILLQIDESSDSYGAIQ